MKPALHIFFAAVALLVGPCLFPSPSAATPPPPPHLPDYTAALMLPAKHESLDILGPELVGTCAPQSHDYPPRCQGASDVRLMDLQGRAKDPSMSVRVEYRTEKFLILATPKDPANPGQPSKWGLITPDGRFLIKPAWGRIQYLGDSALAYEIDTTCPSPTPGKPPVPCRKSGIHNIDLRRTFPAEYDWILPDNTAPYAARKPGNQYGYIDAQGRTVVPFTLNSASRCSEGWCRATQGNDTVYFNAAGKKMLTVPKTNAGNFHEGLAVVQTFERKQGFIDRTGRIVIKAVYSGAEDFHQGFAAVQFGGKWGYIDRTGKTVAPFKWTEAGDFADGFARVVLETFNRDGTTRSLETALINSRGKTLWRNPGDFQFYVEEGFPLVSDHDRGIFGVIDPATGRLLVPMKYSLVTVSGTGLFAVGDGAKLAGLLDRTGSVIFPVAERTVDFNAAGVLVSTGGTTPAFRLLDGTGRGRITKVDYDELEGWNQVPALGTFRRGVTGGLMDAQGRETCTIPGASAGRFVTNATPRLEHRYYERHSTGAFWHVFAQRGLVKFKVNGKWGLYDQSCREVSAPTWEDIGMMRHWMVPVKSGGKWGLLKLTARTAAGNGRGS
jgi:hypothetical protein